MKIETVDKPWGREIIWAKNKHYAGKILEVKKGERLSLQLHEKKTETMYLLQGNAVLEIEDKTSKSIGTVKLEKDYSIDIEPKTVHRLIALEDSRVLEVSTPELTDVVRLKDDYGRKTSYK
jgi:mannose-6-phosphate isomerase